jgi:peptidyl-prolyl cis-trans isomerase B (cyclophilin B)
VPEDRRDEGRKAGEIMKTVIRAFACVVAGLVTVAAQQKSPGAGPVIVLETAKGNIEFETYPEEAPKTVAQVVELVKKNFYNGLRFHRADPNFVIQVGDPVSRDMSRQEWWGRQGSGKPIGVAEITKKRRNVLGAVGMAYTGSPKDADSQFYITRRAAPELDGKYAVFGQVIKGQDVVNKIQKGDVLKRAYLKDEASRP